MKNFLSIIILLFVVNITAMNPKNIPNEKIYQTLNFSVDDVGDVANYPIVQNLQGIAQTSIKNQNGKGFDIYDTQGRRYIVGVAKVRYSEDISIYQQVNQQADYNYIKTRQNIIKTYWKYDTRRVHLRGVETSGKNIQGNDYQTNRNYRNPKRSYYHYQKRDTRTFETILLHRNRSYFVDSWIDYRSLFTYKGKIAKLTKSKYHG